MTRKYRRHFMKSKETKDLLTKASEKLKVDLADIFGLKANVELVETSIADFFLIGGKPLLIKTGGILFPVLTFSKLLASMPKVVVDMGAVPHICNGADVMAPGIASFKGEFSKGDLILVADERHGKIIAIGEAIHDVDIAREVVQGIVVKNIHSVGDRLWELTKELAPNP